MATEIITVKFVCGRTVPSGLESLHNKSGQVRLSDSWESQLTSVFGINLQADRYFLQRDRRAKGVVPIRHELSENVQVLRSEFKNKIPSYRILLAEKGRRSEARASTAAAAALNNSAGTSTPVLDITTPSPRRTGRVTGNWKMATKVKENKCPLRAKRRTDTPDPRREIDEDDFPIASTSSTATPTRPPISPSILRKSQGLFTRVKKKIPEVVAEVPTASDQASVSPSPPPPPVATVYNMENRSRTRHRSMSRRRGFFRNFPLAANEQLNISAPVTLGAASAVPGRGRGRPRKQQRDSSVTSRISSVVVSKKKKSIFEKVFKPDQIQGGNASGSSGSGAIRIIDGGQDLEVTTSASKKVSVPRPAIQGSSGGGVARIQGRQDKQQQRILAVNLGTPVGPVSRSVERVRISPERVSLVPVSGFGGQVESIPDQSDLMPGFKLRANSNFTENQIAKARQELLDLKAKSMEGSQEFITWTLVASTASGIIRDLLGV